MRIKDLPAPQRPRERLLAHGPQALADRELLALLLGSGTDGIDAMELAAKLIAECGGLQALSVADPHALLAALPGVDPAKPPGSLQPSHSLAAPLNPSRRYGSGERLMLLPAPLPSCMVNAGNASS
jgi:DNA repair protein RadC